MTKDTIQQAMVLARYPNLTPDKKMQYMQVAAVENSSSTFKYTDNRLIYVALQIILWAQTFIYSIGYPNGRTHPPYGYMDFGLLTGQITMLK